MNRMNGKQSDFALIRVESNRIVIGYGLKRVEGKEDLYEWAEVYLPKNQTQQLSLVIVKKAILDDINAQVKENITSGFAWTPSGESEAIPVWLSEENQMNFAQAVVPATFKIGEQEGGTPVYHTFQTQEEMKVFCDACTTWKQQCLSEGWERKDSIDWDEYKQIVGDEEHNSPGSK